MVSVACHEHDPALFHELMPFRGLLDLFGIRRADDYGGVFLARSPQPFDYQGIASRSGVLQGSFHVTHIFAHTLLDCEFPADEHGGINGASLFTDNDRIERRLEIQFPDV
jgi:hypothetical protein